MFLFASVVDRLELSIFEILWYSARFVEFVTLRLSCAISFFVKKVDLFVFNVFSVNVLVVLL